jgi:hypothetical protein
VLETIRNMRADGYTHVAEGVGWGLRVLSPGEPFTEGVSYDNQDITKAMVLLTDGENTFERRATTTDRPTRPTASSTRNGLVRPTTGPQSMRRTPCCATPATT